MSILIKLRLTQLKGNLRNIFSRPSSAIITVLLILCYGGMLVPLIINFQKPVINAQAAAQTIMLILIFALSLETIIIFQKKKSLFFLNDAFYLYTGPFERSKILGLYVFDLLTSALFYGLLSLMPVLFMSGSGKIPFRLIAAGLIACTMIHYFVLTVNGIFYLRKLIREKSSKVLQKAFFILLLVPVILLLFFLQQSNFNWSTALAEFYMNPAFHWIPLFGWAKAVMTGAYSGSILLMILGLLALLAVNIAATILLIRIKGDFYENSMMDAESFTEYYQKAKSGQNTQDEKVHKASIRFCDGEMAVYSKNMLLAKKSRDLFRLQDILVIGLYLAMVYFLDFGSGLFTGMMMFWLFINIGNSSLQDDLQHHYIYLLPGRPLIKLTAALIVPYLKYCLIAAVSLIGAGLLLGGTVGTVISRMILCFSFIMVFMASNVMSLRLLKSRTNKMAEQTIRMLFTIITLIPALVVFILLLFTISSSLVFLILPIIAGFNFLTSFLVLLLCSPMLNGSTIHDD